MTEATKLKMGGNERAFRRMMKQLKLRDIDVNGGGDASRASLARNGIELARLLDGTLEPRDRVACVREMRQLTDKLMEIAPAPTTGGVTPNGSHGVDDDDWDTPSPG